MKQFDIRDHVEFDGKGRAQCPSCLKDNKTGKNLSVMENGAYKCFRGCSSDQIREAIGYRKDTPIPPSKPVKKPENVTVDHARITADHNELMTQSTQAKAWLNHRGITDEMIQHYRLGVARAKISAPKKTAKATVLPAISIPIPVTEDNTYYRKKRVRPWATAQPDGYKKWSQWGIPATVYTTHQPEKPTQTWLCEGEWDAMMLGWAVRHSALKTHVQVSCFTCGAGNVPPDPQLAKLTGPVFTLYDLDEAGDRGAKKVQMALKERCHRATVPALDDSPEGWDVSDAINAGLFDQFAGAIATAQSYQNENPLRSRLVTNDQMIARAPDYTDWLVDDILTADELFLLAASPRAGKSLMALTLTHAVASGGKFLGRPVSQGAVIYVRCEDSETKTKERELKQGWGEGLPVYWLDKFKLSELEHLEQLVEELDVRLVVLDTLSRIRDASISESSAEMSQLLEPLQEMCKRQRTCCLLVHHTGKVSVDNAGDINVYDTIRGSSAIRATCRGTLILAANDNKCRLYCENGWGKLDLDVLLDANTLTWKLLGNWIAPNIDVSQKDRVLHYLTGVGTANIDQIAEGTNLPKRSLYEVLKRLQSDELVIKVGNRTNAVYTKTAIQQIQQLNSLLNSCNEDRENISASIQQESMPGPPPEKVIINEKSDPKNEHFNERKIPPTTGNIVESEPELLTDQALRIQHQFNTIQQSHSTKQANPDSESDTEFVNNSTGDDPRTTIWITHIEFDTKVKLIKRNSKWSRVEIPGLGVKTVDNALLHFGELDDA